MNFTAIDFETANYDRSSACSIGLVRVRKGKIVDTMYSLIKPPTGYFLPMFVDIHGIDTEVVRDAPTFADLWPEVATFVGKDKLVAHNYSFDKRVLEATLGYYAIEPPSNSWMCTLELSRRAWPQLGGHGLDVVAASLGIPLHHHDALDDAKACALICVAAKIPALKRR